MKRIGMATTALVWLIAAFIYNAITRLLLQDEYLPQAQSISAVPAVYPLPVSENASLSLHALSRESIEYLNQNGRKKNGTPAERKIIPRLVLFRNGALTDPVDRTLVLTFNGVVIPPPGAWLTVRARTEHSDPDRDVPIIYPYQILNASHWVTSTYGTRIEFSYQIGGTIPAGDKAIVTPTDYYRIEVGISQENPSSVQPEGVLSIEYAFLLENEWQADLPRVPEASAGASPHHLIVYYCDMMRYQFRFNDPKTKLHRIEVADFISEDLIPTFIDAYRRMGTEWGFAWHAEWISLRAGGDREELSIALSDGLDWYHGKAPMVGLSYISINVASGQDEKAMHTSLTQKISRTLQHELFHSYQRSMTLHFTGTSALAGVDDTWGFFSEGTATLASTVLDSEHQFSRDSGIYGYLFIASKFIQEDLNRSYREIDPYHAALYWRFLYEQCSGLSTGSEDPAQGMQVIRRALEVAYSGEVVDIQSSPDIVAYFPEIIDRALEGSSCGFQTFQGSLLAFTRAIYTLRFTGTAPEAGDLDGDRFYDPNQLYPEPPTEKIEFNGSPVEYTGGISSSYGIDFLEVKLDHQTAGNSISVEISTPGEKAEFIVQVMALIISDDGDLRPISLNLEPIDLTGNSPDNRATFEVMPGYTNPIERLSVLITRIDANETVDPLGEYQVKIYSE